MSEKIEIKEITIKIGRRELKLTPEEVRELHNKLGDLLGKKNGVQLVPYYPYYPVYPWWQPTVTIPYVADPYISPTWTITSGDCVKYELPVTGSTTFTFSVDGVVDAP